MRRLLRRTALPLAALALWALPSAPLHAAPDDAPRIYRWIDSDGIAHYTTDPERIPTALRARLPQAAPSGPDVPEARPRSSDVWAERDRPPEASEIESLGDDEIGFEDPVRQARIEEIDARINDLLVRIAGDEEALKLHVVGPGADPMAAGDDEALRTIAGRLPGLLSELGELRDERASLEAR